MIRPPAYFQQVAAGRIAHVAGQHDVVDLVFVQQFDQPLVVRLAVRVANRLPIDVKLFGDPAARIAIADHHGRLARICPSRMARSTASGGSGR